MYIFDPFAGTGGALMHACGRPRALSFFLIDMTRKEPSMVNSNALNSARQSRALLRLEQVQAITGLSRSSVYKLISESKFPASIALHGRAVAWDSQAVDAWIESRITAAA